ncbi:hypothetical protein FUAX_47740 (plasmid) [Fulvitalea axinellae]|uniref:Phosphatidylinositol diacylglycerol-lyase n=1 Tax=Fulvitalea axinellae TaxID=1182444 RepID=A0AAU9CWT0_9BACT|nr:hypothetical protein FUAX_47740 [Fulvitalea axinellae]
MRQFYFPLIVAGTMLFSCSHEFEEPSLAQPNQNQNLALSASQWEGEVAEPLKVISRDERTIDKIMYPTTHNSFNYKGSRYDLENVYDNLPTQFAKGIRAVEIDIHEKTIYKFPFTIKKEIAVYHGKITNGSNGSEIARKVLQRITDFIEANPTEIVFLKIETTVSGSDIDKVLRDSHLDQHIYKRTADNPYPTPEDVIASGKRVITTRTIEGSKLYGPSLDRKTFGGKYSDNDDHQPQTSPSEKKFFSLDYYGVTSILGAGDDDRASYIMHPSRMGPFVEDVWKLNGRKPWRVNVDFPSIHNGNYYQVIKDNNAKAMLMGEVRDTDGNLLLKKDGSLIHWTWDCDYNSETVRATTSAEFSFPIEDDETVTIHPVSNDYDFVPQSVTVTSDNVSDFKQVFVAIPK